MSKICDICGFTLTKNGYCRRCHCRSLNDKRHKEWFGHQQILADEKLTFEYLQEKYCDELWSFGDISSATGCDVKFIKERLQVYNIRIRNKSENLSALYERDPGRKQRISEAMKRNWADPDSEHNSPEFRQKMSNARKRDWQDPEYRERQSRRVAMWWNDPANIEKVKEIHSKVSKTLIRLWQESEFRERGLVHLRSEERRQICSRSSKVHWSNPGWRAATLGALRVSHSTPEYRAKMSGPSNPAWRGGISKDIYPSEFDENLREFIRGRDNCRCVICKLPETVKDRELSVHHIDYNRENSDPDNLISLCVRCHMQTNHNRGYWEVALGDLQNCRQVYRAEIAQEAASG